MGSSLIAVNNTSDFAFRTKKTSSRTLRRKRNHESNIFVLNPYSWIASNTVWVAPQPRTQKNSNCRQRCQSARRQVGSFPAQTTRRDCTKVELLIQLLTNLVFPSCLLYFCNLYSIVCVLFYEVAMVCCFVCPLSWKKLLREESTNPWNPESGSRPAHNIDPILWLRYARTVPA